MRCIIIRVSAWAVPGLMVAVVLLASPPGGWAAAATAPATEVPVAIGAIAMEKIVRTTSSEAAIKEGNSAYEDEQYELAAAWFGKAVQLSPKSSEALVLRGQARVKIGIENLAMQDFDEAIRLNPKSKEALRWRGALQLDTMEYDQALCNVNEALRLDPSFAAAYNTRAWAHNLRGETNASLEDLASALRFSPELSIAQKNLATLTRRYGNPGKLVETYTNLARTNPDAASRYYALAAEHCMSSKDLARAVELLSEAIRLDPKKTIYRVKRAYCYIDLGKHDDALADLEAALQINPKDAWAYNNRGYLYQLLGSTDRALADYTRAIEADPHFSKPYYNIKDIYHDLGRPEGILRELEEAARLNTNAAAIYYYQGGLHFRFLKRYKDSIDQLSKAIRLDPHSTDAINERGRSYWDMKQYESALKDFDELIRLDSTLSFAHLNRGGILAALGKPSEAIAEYKLAMRADPSDQTAHTRLRGMRNKPADRTLLIEDYTELLKIHPEGATSYFLERGKIHLDLEHFPEAISDFTATIERQPLNSQAYLERAKARRLSGDYAGGLKDAQHVLVEQPTFGSPMVESGLNLQLLGRDREALDMMSKAVKSNPDTAYFRMSRGLIQAEHGEFEEALSDFNEAIRLNKTTPFYFYYRSRIQLNLGNGAAAAEDAREFLRRQGWNSGNSAWAVFVGQLGYQQAGQDEKAKELLDEAKARLGNLGLPNILVRHLRGEIREEVVMARAMDDISLFAAHFYLGLEQLRIGRMSDARRHLVWATENPQKDFVPEYYYAVAQLAKIGPGPNNPVVAMPLPAVTPRPDLNRGLVVYLPLKQDLTDHSSNQHPVKVVGRVKIQDGAARFDGGNDYLDLPHIDLAQNPWAISFWVRFTGTNSMYGLIEQKDSDVQDRYFHVMLRGKMQPQLGFYMNDVISPSSLELRESWHHLVFQFTGLHQQIWVDGRLLCERVCEPYEGVVGRTFIGKSPRWKGIPGRNLEGYLKELRIYDRELAFQEIGSLTADSPLDAGPKLASSTGQRPAQTETTGLSPGISVTLLPPRPFLSINGKTLTISSPPIQVYDLQATSDLNVDWAHLVTLTNTAGQVQYTDAESAKVSTRFYRVLVTFSSAATERAEK